MILLLVFLKDDSVIWIISVSNAPICDFTCDDPVYVFRECKTCTTGLVGGIYWDSISFRLPTWFQLTYHSESLELGYGMEIFYFTSFYMLYFNM